MELNLVAILGETLACGTGACAAVVAAVLEGRVERVSVECWVKLGEQLFGFLYADI